MSRPKSPPPELPGFVYQRGLGGGGFADVYLYTQVHPHRPAAVKVLRQEHLTPESVAQFRTEANVMASVSAHRFIVEVYLAGVAPDGRPFIAMEYYPLAHFGLRAQGGGLRVAEVLRTAVKVASAVETAHRAGILHRDIKPQNILTSAYNQPGLADFGIAGVVADGTADAAAGVSVAWAPRETFLGDGHGGQPSRAVQITSDVYSLAATIYTLLTGRPPFWVSGGDNTDMAMMPRVVAGGARPTGREDVPASLNHLLLNSLSTDPANRPPTALAFARAVNDIERELRLPPTEIELPVGEDTLSTPIARPQDGPDDEDATRSRGGIQVVSPEPEAPPAPRPAPAPARTSPPAPAGTWLGSTAATDLDEGQTVRKPTPTGSPVTEVDEPALRAPTRRPLKVAAAVAAALVVLVGLGVAVASSGSGGGGTTTTTTDPERALANTPLVPDLAPPTGVTVGYDPASRELAISWQAPEAVAEDPEIRYRIVREGDGHAGDELEQSLDGVFDPGVDGTEVAIAGVPPDDEGICVSVATLSSGRISDPSVVTCTGQGS